MHPEGMEVRFGGDGTDRLPLAADSAVLVATSISYRLVSRRGEPRLLVVVAMRQKAGTGHQRPEPCYVAVGEDEAAGASASHEGQTAGGDAEPLAAEDRRKKQGSDLGLSEVDEEMNVKAQVEAALARIMAAAVARMMGAADAGGDRGDGRRRPTPGAQQSAESYGGG